MISRDFIQGTGTAALVAYGCDFPASSIKIINDSAVPADELEYSFDGVKIAGKLFGGESFSYEHISPPVSEIYIKGNTVPFRIFFWN